MSKKRKTRKSRTRCHKNRTVDNHGPARHSKQRTRSIMSDGPHRDHMLEFSARIVAELEKGAKPWVRPWDPEKAGGPQAPFIR